jgi:hypothetical protein
MKNIVLILLLFTLFSCKNEVINSNPDQFLTLKEQSEFKYSIVRYVDDLARNASQSNKFDTIYNSEYLKRASKMDLLFYYNDSIKKTVFFAVTKIAPSLKLKKVATVGQIKYTANGDIAFYEEGFRTWKMEPTELKEKTQMLFTKYIKREDLSKFYTVNSNPEFYIEFPDEVTAFDTINRGWKTTSK